MADDNRIMLTIYIVFFVSCLLFSILINNLFLKFSRTLGIRNPEETIIRWGTQSKPALGGIAFFIIFLLSISSFTMFFGEGNLIRNREFMGLLSATTLAFLMGLADDAYNTKPWLKFFTQVLCGVLLSAAGVQIDLFAHDWLNNLCTILWVVGIMNSINMLDNMDAITTVVSLSVIVTVLLMILIQNRSDHFFLMILLGMTSALLGFLYYNWHPSKMYMGDTGSQFLGVFLAAISIIFLWNYNVSEAPVSKRIVLTALAFVLPIADTSTVIINRIMKKKSPFVGGRDHTTHHLAYLGLNDRQVATLFWAISMISLILILLTISNQIPWTDLSFILLTGYPFSIFVILFLISRRKNGKYT